MTPCSLMTCEDLDASDCSTLPTSTSLGQQESGCGSLPLTGTVHGRNRLSSTEAGGMMCRPSLPRESSFDQPANSQTSYTHITILSLSMETADYSSPEVERLKSENATLRRRIQTLEAEIATLQAKVINVWGTC